MDLIKQLNKITRVEEPRKYIGASSIGHPCYRLSWYELHHPELKEKIDSRTYRIFMIGDAIEEILIKLIEKTGIQILRLSDTLSDSILPYFQGHVDAILPNDNCILEIKSAKDSSFKIFKKKGLKGWYPAYYAQVQCYMAFADMPKALVLAFNKDNAELHSEIVEFDEEEYLRLRFKAKAIHDSPTEPPRLSESPTWFQCKMCDFYKHCHNIEG